MKSFFTPEETCTMADVSYRQLQYWDKTKFIRPSCLRKGKFRLYSFVDLIQLKLAKVLRDKVSIQRLRREMIPALRKILAEITWPLEETTFLMEGSRILAFRGGVVMNRECAGHYLRFSVADLRRQIDAAFPKKQPQLPLKIVEAA